MNTAKNEVTSLLDKLPEDCTLEDVQYHLYVIEKIQRGISRAEAEGTLNQQEVERKFSKWTTAGLPTAKRRAFDPGYFKSLVHKETHESCLPHEVQPICPAF